MKKLNRKGFTLVELLAVIIILAVVVGITIPAILTTTGNAKKKAAQNAANVAADWFDRQYQSYLIGDPTMSQVNSYFKTYCSAALATGTGTCAGVEGEVTEEQIVKASGLTSANVNKFSVTFSEGRSCVKFTGAGDYKEAGDLEGGNCTSSKPSSGSVKE